MRIPLDEWLPEALGAKLIGHEVATVVGCGWSGINNGKLLALAATRFDVFVTADQNIEYQQKLSTLPLSVLVLVVKSNRIESIVPLVAELLFTLPKLVRRAAKSHRARRGGWPVSRAMMFHPWRNIRCMSRSRF